jgi:hypothetical protein
LSGSAWNPLMNLAAIDINEEERTRWRVPPGSFWEEETFLNQLWCVFHMPIVSQIFRAEFRPT